MAARPFDSLYLMKYEGICIEWFCPRKAECFPTYVKSSKTVVILQDQPTFLHAQCLELPFCVFLSLFKQRELLLLSVFCPNAWYLCLPFCILNSTLVWRMEFPYLRRYFLLVLLFDLFLLNGLSVMQTQGKSYLSLKATWKTYRYMKGINCVFLWVFFLYSRSELFFLYHL